MRHYITYILVFVAVALLPFGRAEAQDQIVVTGKIVKASDGTPFSIDDGIEILAYDNIIRAQDEYKNLLKEFEENEKCQPSITQYNNPNADGSYEVSVADNGAILFVHYFNKPVLEIVKGRKRINVKINDQNALNTASVYGKQIVNKDPVIEEEMVVGNQYSKKMVYYFNKDMLGEIEGIGMTNARLVSQVYVVRADGTDTLEFQKPLVLHGEQFHQTQALWSQDTLYKIAAADTARLSNNRDSILFDVKFEVPDKAIYHCKANIWLEDYIKTYYQDTCFLLSTARVRRPFQFLEYTFDECRLNHDEHFRAARKEKVGTAKNMKLQFKVGRAELDKSDTLTVATLDSLKQEFKQICDDILRDRDAGRKSSTSLDDISFEGYSSPEGSYVRNQALSNARTQSVRSEVFSVIPKFVQDRLNSDRFKGFVHGWDEVANILERDSLKAEAEAVRAIVAKYPGNLDKQGADVRKLPYYNAVIKDRLGELRQVKCNYSVSIERALFPEEILANYNDGKKTNLTLNEYWHLFTLIKDEKELEALYKDAYNRSKRVEPLNRPWVLAANNLAISYLRREHVDTTILKPHLMDGEKVNYSEMDMINPNIRYYYNYPEIIANQAQMFMLAGNYQRAVQLTNKIKSINDNYKLLDAVCKLMGRYKLDVEDKEALYKLIEKSSQRNKVVMRLYQKQYDSVAVAIKALPQDDPLTDYFKVQYLCGKCTGTANMRNRNFDREEDPSLSMPGDTVVYDIDEATIAKIENDIKATDNEIKIKDDDIELYTSLGMPVNEIQAEKAALLEKKAALLEEKAKIERGEPMHIKAECTVYDVAFHYLKRCFQKDKSYIDIARGDLDIDEELLNDVLGIKTTKK